jgi:hypothetical protein
MNIDNNIKNLTNQNNSIYKGLSAKNIEFTRFNIDDNLTKEEILEVLTKENEALKDLAKNNRPPSQVKEPKKVVEQISVPKKEKDIENTEEKEESFEDPIKKFSTITNLEDIKRAFFNKEYEQFETLIKQHNLKYYSASYNYASDKDGCQEFIAKNLLKGFVRNLDDFRKYFIVAFRCYIESDKKYSYPSLWILNSDDDISNIIGSLYEDFTFSDVDINNIDTFLKDFRKKDDNDDKLLDEVYLH